MAPGYSSEVIHFFAARDLREGGAEMEPDEVIENEIRELGEILERIRSNAIEDAKTIIGILTISSKA